MNVLIACEESQTVCKEMRALGHCAFSCDILECSGGHPEWHIQGDCIPIINGKCSFTTMDGVEHTINDRWDILIAHPPCTYLTLTGNRWFNEKYGEKAIKRRELQKEAIEFFMKFVNADCEKIAIENPVGCMSTLYRKPNQIIEPYYFGDKAKKRTCLWLKNLAVLAPTDIVDFGETIYGLSIGASAYHAVDENGKILSWHDPKTARIRSKTFRGIAKAMAEQWAGNCNTNKGDTY